MIGWNLNEIFTFWVHQQHTKHNSNDSKSDSFWSIYQVGGRVRDQPHRTYQHKKWQIAKNIMKPPLSQRKQVDRIESILSYDIDDELLFFFFLFFFNIIFFCHCFHVSKLGDGIVRHFIDNLVFLIIFGGIRLDFPLIVDRWDHLW